MTSALVVEVDARRSARGDLFRAAFRQAIPAFPRHFVAFCRDASGSLRVVAYLHHTPWEGDAYLAGGLCIDARAYRHAARDESDAWTRQGGRPHETALVTPGGARCPSDLK